MAVYADTLDLRFAVSDHVGNKAISDVFPRLIQQAELRLNDELRTVWQLTPATLTFTAGVATLPTDFLEMMHLFGIEGCQMYAGMDTDLRLPGTSYSTYAIGNGTVSIRGFSGTRDAEYYAKLPTLSASMSSTNWLLDRFPNAYLYSVGLEAAKFLKDVELATATDQLRAFAVDEVKKADQRMRWSNSIVRTQGINP